MTEGGPGVTCPEKGPVARCSGNKLLSSVNREKFTGQEHKYCFPNRKLAQWN